MNFEQDFREYRVDECISFRKTDEKFGGLSNMAPGYKIYINSVEVLNSEALYQAFRYSYYPDIQREIILQKSPMTAKMVSKKYRSLSRNDWEKNKVTIMRWCLRAKLIFNWKKFGQLLDSTGNKIIVEDSNKDSFWGARLDSVYFRGTNALGRLLMELREIYREAKSIKNISLEPLKIRDFLFLNKEIPTIFVDVTKNDDDTHTIFDFYDTR